MRLMYVFKRTSYELCFNTLIKTIFHKLLLIMIINKRKEKSKSNNATYENFQNYEK